MLLELSRRGFRIIQENNPVFLRRRIEEARPFTSYQPVLLISPGSLEDLPFDLYQPAYRLSLSLHQYFPNLAYPVLQTLSPDQVHRLAACPPPVETLSRQKTIAYLLREVFQAGPPSLNQPHALVAWLNEYHRANSPLPDLLRSSMVESLKRIPAYCDWEVDLLLSDRQAFSSFVQQQWQISVEKVLAGRSVQENGPGYQLSFHRDPQLQDLVPALVRQGSLRPLEIPAKNRLPGWAYAGITRTDTRLSRFTSLLEKVETHLKRLQSETETYSGWNQWHEIALDWSELCSLRFQTGLQLSDTHKGAFRRLLPKLDRLFAAWLHNSYTMFGAQRLPNPHHVYHVPHYLAYLRSIHQVERIVLIILDGLSLTDWQVIRPEWTKRHAGWKIKTDTLLAQVPTITSISRYALVSGLRPSDFISEMEHHPPEPQAWELFWSREGVALPACRLMPISFDRGIDPMPELQDPRVQFWCLIEDTPDKLAHNTSLGAAGQQASLRLWLDPAQEQNSLQLENLIETFLERGFSIFIASDHGNVEATGEGRPSEGLLAQTRGKRARIYQDRLAAQRVQISFPDTILWEHDGILPDQMAVLMPAGRNAFTLNGEVVVTHGGISVEEIMVPFVQIERLSD